ncbi:MAG TPA: hypothetical protein VG755_00535 [Nannocystaceae bacterium]|nr:hypothetical protein [Nannocystaceae bacterium]
MQAVQRRADLLDVEVERAVWSRGSRPWPGRALRFGFASLFLGLALAVPDLTTRLIFVATGVLALLFIQPLMDSRLEAIGRAIGEADRRRASRLLASLDTQRLVVLFASHGWVALQRGRLNLVLGNGRAAAKSFFDASRILGVPGLPALVSAQAHALMMAGDRKEARPLLQTLEKGELLSPRDRVDLGLALLEESGRASAARTQLEAAREQLGGHPRVLAGLALAYARTDDGNEGLALLEAAEKADGIADDEIATELVKRARKALRPVMEAAEKRQRKARAAAGPSAAERAAAEPGSAKASKKDRKDRRKERREKRRAAKAEAAASSEAAADSSAEAAIAAADDDDDADDVSATETGEQTTLPVVRVDERADADAAKRRADAEAAKRRADEDEAKRRADEAKRRAEADEAKRRAELEAEAETQRAAAEAAKRRAEEEAALHRAAAEAEAQKQLRAAEAEAEKLRLAAEAEVAAAKRRADEEAAKLRAEEEAAKRRAAAAAPTPTFLPPPLPEAPAPKTAAAPPVVQAPSVAASTTPAAPAVDESGWDDLLGDNKS